MTNYFNPVVDVESELNFSKKNKPPELGLGQHVKNTAVVDAAGPIAGLQVFQG